MADELRNCEWCDKPFEGRTDAKFCSRNHKRSAARARKRKAQRVATTLAKLTPCDSHAKATVSSRESDERFRAMLAADEARRTPNVKEAEWRAYEKKHGTAHPDRIKDRIARQQAEKDAAMALVDYRRPLSRFDTSGPTLAEQARLSRGQSRRPLPVQPGDWTDDPDLMEPAQTITMPDGWRRGPRAFR